MVTGGEKEIETMESRRNWISPYTGIKLKTNGMRKVNHGKVHGAG